MWWDLKYLYVFLRNNCWGSLPCNKWVNKFFKKVGAIADVQGPPAELSPYAADTFTWLVSMWGEASHPRCKHRALMVKGVAVISLMVTRTTAGMMEEHVALAAFDE